MINMVGFLFFNVPLKVVYKSHFSNSENHKWCAGALCLWVNRRVKTFNTFYLRKARLGVEKLQNQNK